MPDKQSPFSLETGLKTMRLQALPCLHLPEKSHPKPSIPRRRIISKVETIKAVQKTVPKYETLCKNLSKYAIENSTFSHSEERFVLNYLESEYYLSKFELCVENPLEFTILVYAFLLQDTHFIYRQNKRSVRNISIPTLLEQIPKCLICAGIKQNMSKSITHSIPSKINSSFIDERFRTKEYYRSEECTLLCKNNEICVECIKLEKKILSLK